MWSCTHRLEAQLPAPVEDPDWEKRVGLDAHEVMDRPTERRFRNHKNLWEVYADAGSRDTMTAEETLLRARGCHILAKDTGED